jgi:hypothetical protein
MIMPINRLHCILSETTAQLRKGAEVEERTEKSGLHVTEVFAMPPASHPSFDDCEKVDVEFCVIAVDKKRAEDRRTELVDILKQYPNPERLADGPSYIEVGAEIGDQGAALQLFALGKVLGLWDIITPKIMGFEGEEASQMAGMGLVMISGFRPSA